ncbi:MAG: imelysin family protein [Myxococcota bacterium]|nr:imelysin family protein [Myxococcota bacterium]
MLILIVFACATKVQSNTTPAYDISNPSAQNYLQSHADYATDLWSRTAKAAKALDQTIQAFQNTPSPETLSAAKKQWLETRTLYSQTESLRFQNGPIDNPDTGVEGFLNAWPLDESYVDYTSEDPNAGIINNVEQYPEINRSLLLSLNERGGEENISTGFHAIEFILWGQDMSTEAPGNRPVTDFTEHPQASRRLAYLQLSSKLLVQHLEEVHTAWTDSYRKTYTAKNPQEIFTGIWTGMAMLTGDEMAGERMAVPYETKDQEDEQSCFSDSTLQDFQNNLVGIHNQYHGYEGKVGLRSIIQEHDSNMDEKITRSLQEAIDAVNNIPHPFDQSIQNEEHRPKVEIAITKLEDLSDVLVAGASSMGIRVLLEGGS